MEIPEEYSDGGELNTGLLVALGPLRGCAWWQCASYIWYTALRRLKIGGGRTAVVQTRVSRRKLSLLAWLKRIGSAVKERWLLLAAIVTMRAAAGAVFVPDPGRTPAGLRPVRRERHPALLCAEWPA